MIQESWFTLIAYASGMLMPIFICCVFKLISFIKQFKDEIEMDKTVKPRKVNKKRFKNFVMCLLDYYLEKSRW